MMESFNISHWNFLVICRMYHDYSHCQWHVHNRLSLPLRLHWSLEIPDQTCIYLLILHESALVLIMLMILILHRMQIKYKIHKNHMLKIKMFPDFCSQSHKYTPIWSVISRDHCEHSDRWALSCTSVCNKFLQFYLWLSHSTLYNSHLQ